MKKIALLFLIYDIINQEEAWHNFLKNVDKDKYSIYIHYKYDKELKYFNEYKLKECIATEYCKPSIVQAHNLLIREALNDENNYKFITLSQACFPFKTFDYIYDELIKDNLSYFNMVNHCPDIFEEQINDSPSIMMNRFIKLSMSFDKKDIKLSSNWFILNRELAENMITNEASLLPKFNDIFCPEEHYFIMNVYLNNLQDQIVINNYPEEYSTFTNWVYEKNKGYKFYEEHNYKSHKGGLKNYYVISIDEIKYLISSKCLFGRKINKECLVFERKSKKLTPIHTWIENFK